MVDVQCVAMIKLLPLRHHRGGPTPTSPVCDPNHTKRGHRPRRDGGKESATPTTPAVYLRRTADAIGLDVEVGYLTRLGADEDSAAMRAA
jgi:hypothetical protein